MIKIDRVKMIEKVKAYIAASEAKILDLTAKQADYDRQAKEYEERILAWAKEEVAAGRFTVKYDAYGDGRVRLYLNNEFPEPRPEEPFGGRRSEQLHTNIAAAKDDLALLELTVGKAFSISPRDRRWYRYLDTEGN